MPAFPSPVTPGRSRGPRVFPWASHPTGQDRPRTPRRGRVTDTDSGPRLRHRSTSNRRARLQRATSRRNARKRCTFPSSTRSSTNRIVPGQVHRPLHSCPLCPGVSPTHVTVSERRSCRLAVAGDHGLTDEQISPSGSERAHLRRRATAAGWMSDNPERTSSACPRLWTASQVMCSWQPVWPGVGLTRFRCAHGEPRGIHRPARTESTPSRRCA
jgi:hypothetical protein